MSVVDDNIRQYCTFWVSGHLYGVDILNVKEVNPEATFTEVFHAPEEVRGFVNIRGQIHLILDLRRILGLEPQEVSEKSRLVLFKPIVGESFGVLVDSIGDVVEAPDEQIETGGLVNEDLPGAEERVESSPLISGVCRLEGALLLIINARNLLRVIEKAVVV